MSKSSLPFSQDAMLADVTINGITMRIEVPYTYENTAKRCRENLVSIAEDVDARSLRDELEEYVEQFPSAETTVREIRVKDTFYEDTMASLYEHERKIMQ